MGEKQSHQGNCFTSKYPILSYVLKNEVEIESTVDSKTRLVARAIWDTGANISVIRPEVAAKLGLSVVSMTTISTPTSKDEPAPVYLVNLLLPNKVPVSGVHVVGGIPKDCEMLIGMDIISRGDFIVSNYRGKTVFTFRMPSMAEYDFCKHSYLLPKTNENKTGRNDPCPCGSGKKYKQCCGK